MSTRAFLDRLFRNVDSGVVEVRALPSKRRAWAALEEWGTLGPFVTAEVNAQQNLYVGVATRRDTSSGTTENLCQLGALWVDFDCPPAEAVSRLEGFPLQPSMVVHSGAGAHYYWSLKEVVDLQNPAELRQAASLLRRLAGRFGGDDRATDPARILRLPGTVNFKYGEPRSVVLAQVADHTVDLSELDEWLPREVVRDNQMALETDIVEHTRNDRLYSTARALRARGVSPGVLFQTIERMNEEQCKPPLPREEMSAIVKHALTQRDRPDFEPPSSVTILHDATPERVSADVRFITAAEFTARLDEPLTYVVQPYLVADALVDLTAPVKKGKTRVRNYFTRCALEGAPCLGFPACASTPVVLLTEESGPALAEGLEAANLSHRTDLSILTRGDARGASWEQMIALAVTRVHETRARLLIVDTVAGMARLKGDAEQSSGGAFDVLRPLQDANLPGVAKLLIRHARKADGDISVKGRGSNAFAGEADVLLDLTRPPDMKPTVRHLEQIGRFDRIPTSLYIDRSIELLPGSDRLVEQYTVVAAEDVKEQPSTENTLLRALPRLRADAVDATTLAAAVKLSEWTVRQTLNALCEQGRVVRVGVGSKRDHYRFYVPGTNGNGVVGVAAYSEQQQQHHLEESEE